MARKFADDAESALQSGISVGGTSLSLPAGHGSRFPATGDFTLRLQDASDATIYELVTCTARSTDTLTISPTTLAWDVADKVFHVVAKADFDSFAQGNLANYQALSAYTQAGSILVGTGAGASAERVPSTAAVATNQGTTSISYTDLTTVGPSVTVTTGTMALVIVSAEMWNSTSAFAALMAFAVSGATTRAGADAEALRHQSGTASEEAAASRMTLVTGLTPGSNTFTAKYRANGGTAQFLNRAITVIPL
jgi:hypothetical protein